jgi:hypothetical protein
MHESLTVGTVESKTRVSYRCCDRTKPFRPSGGSRKELRTFFLEAKGAVHVFVVPESGWPFRSLFSLYISNLT